MARKKTDIDLEEFIIELLLDIETLQEKPVRPSIDRGIDRTFYQWFYSHFLLAREDTTPTAETPGILTDNAKDLIDRAEILEDALSPVVGGPEVPRLHEALKRRARRKFEELAEAIRDALQKAREAKASIRGAATAAKKHSSVRPHLGSARESFKEAERSLGKYDRDKTSANTSLDFGQLKVKLADARSKVDEDLGHLQDALDQLD